MALNQKLHSPLFNALSKSKKSLSKLFKNVYYLDQTLRNYDDHHSLHTFYFGSESFRFHSDNEIIKRTICCPKDTERFDESLIWKISNFYTVWWHWFLKHIHFRFGSPFTDLSSLRIFSLNVLLHVFRSCWEKYQISSRFQPRFVLAFQNFLFFYGRILSPCKFKPKQIRINCFQHFPFQKELLLGTSPY